MGETRNHVSAKVNRAPKRYMKGGERRVLNTMGPRRWGQEKGERVLANSNGKQPKADFNPVACGRLKPQTKGARGGGAQWNGPPINFALREERAVKTRKRKNLRSWLLRDYNS